MSLPWTVGAVGALLVSAAVAWATDEHRRVLADRLRSRLLLGVPWGTLVSVALVVAVYLFLQGGLAHWNDPVTLPFRAWSYLYPLGVVSAAFSHGGPGHLLGNLTGTLVLAPIAEYAWGHYPDERGASTFSSLGTNPYVRAFVAFPAAVVAVGLFTGAFALGPVIGFSGVVFAFAGFALVHYPLTTVAAALGGQAVLQRTYRALLDPVIIGGTSASGPSPPWWAEIAIQGHAIGLLLGILLGLAVARRRDRGPGAVRLWAAVVAFAVPQGLWAVYWFRGNGEYVLYQALGLALVAGLALVVTVAVTATDRPLPRPGGDASRRTVASVVLLVSLAALAGPAVPTNALTVDDGPTPTEGAVTVDGYTVTYAEDVRNRMIPAVDVSLFGEDTNVTTSGVIVVNRDRHIWTQAASKQALAYDGYERIRVGGVGWDAAVDARRVGWSAVGGGTAYHVWLRTDGERPEHAFNSSAATAEPRVSGTNLTVVATERGGFRLRVTEGNRTLAREPMPAANESVTVAGVTFERDGDALFAVRDGTRVRVAEREGYR
ncbi:rhomboid family intramembrane serine protease [Halostella litorea]|uniref:rhomboid family intramembrane serine protease n=1 Tax=Halostella litorea TaxID=2528831 RepID=UPI001092D0CA|nr:rhomboid family intramembrane serine protease [Halostella litorea]